MRHRFALLLLAATIASGPACFRFANRAISEVPTERPQVVESPLRAFLANGSVAVFEDGALITSSDISGDGVVYDLMRNPTTTGALALALDSVIGVEAFDHDTNVPLTILAAVGSAVVITAGAVAIACAVDPKCFGSCPTVYTYDAQGEVLEAEAFSYSVSPLLEGRDVDALSSTAADSAGVVSLEIRNEALETHFINHLELLEVRHGEGDVVLTDASHAPIVVAPTRPFAWARDRAGRDVADALGERDGVAFSSSEARVTEVVAGDDRDWIDAEIPAIDADTAAVVLRLRNSLLNTILFYEFMLGRQGAGALDWMARDLDRIGGAVELGSWFHQTMGLRLSVETDEGFREVARLGDTGPIAWKDVAFRVPVRRGAPTRIRLSFLTDEWRIDRLAWSPRIVDAEVVTHAASRIEPLGTATEADLIERVRAADDDYLVTTAGTGFTARFQVGPAPPGAARTFLLSSQGYYSEWVRPRWIREGDPDWRFEPGPDVIPSLMERWAEVKGPMEAAFHGTRIPVR
ncbi:MAG TPA: hypothetical protein VK837_02440 [Longimicrobiales bacterium]|nr:hypothetical protein [Longimicrobiales bacterium]